jgi:hypothetical protein
MAEAELAIGAKVNCSDGLCGEVSRMIIDPATDTVTHLVVTPRHRREAARLVPADLVDTASGDIRLRCTLAEFGRLDHAEERELADEADEHVGDGGLLGDGLVYDVADQAYGPGATPIGPGLTPIGHVPGRRRTIIEDVVPVGDTQLRPGDRVHALDGEIGRVHGFLVSPGDDRVTHVLLEEGHLWGHKEVAIPVGDVSGVDAGVRVNLTKEQVGSLPPAG